MEEMWEGEDDLFSVTFLGPGHRTFVVCSTLLYTILREPCAFH